jgi:hypothetical protein
VRLNKRKGMKAILIYLTGLCCIFSGTYLLDTNQYFVSAISLIGVGVLHVSLAPILEDIL